MKHQKGVKILIVGGGSGGHLTPLIAIAKALKHKDPNVSVGVVGQRNENLQMIVLDQSIDDSYEISAGKLRRYHGKSILDHALDIRTVLLNIRDAFRLIVGIFQALKLLRDVKPDAIMLKGGFVCVPVGIAARLRRVPYITHDSDAIPGLANRITAKYAVYNTTAMAPELYPYDSSKTVQVGVPLRSEFSAVGAQEQASYKKELGIRPHDRVLFCTGGGLGARKLNELVSTLSPYLLVEFPDLQIIHLSGKKLFDQTRKMYHKMLSEDLFNRVRVIDFEVDLYRLSGAADVVITRAGATSLAEFGAQAKACIVVPNPILTGGQQTHNAKILTSQEAAIVVDEDSLNDTKVALKKLLSSGNLRKEYASKLHETFASGDASDRLADMLLSISGRAVYGKQSNDKLEIT